MRQPTANAGPYELQAGLDNTLPSELQIGRGMVLPLVGWYRLTAGSLKQLELLVEGLPQRLSLAGFGWRAEPGHAGSAEQITGRRGFCGFVSLRPRSDVVTIAVGLRATLRDGSVLESELGQLALGPTAARVSAPVATRTTEAQGPLVAIALATHAPRFDLLTRQIRSIQAQSHQNFVCLIGDDGSSEAVVQGLKTLVGDDGRFSVCAASERSGFYRNFERCLELLPPTAELIALADQDDDWYPDKIATLVSAFTPSTTLVYSDMRIVDDQDRVLAESFWSQRRNNSRDLGTLLIANTVTGAASMFRRELLAYALPFPAEVGKPFHDQWLACVALALGEIRYIDRALYDYVQHRGNAFGYGGWSRAVGSQGRPNGRPRVRLARSFGRWRRVYFDDLLRIVQLASMLKQRCGDQLSADKDRAVGRVAELEYSPGGPFWLAARCLCQRGVTSQTLGLERELLRAVLWMWATRARAAYSKRRPQSSAVRVRFGL